MIIQPIVNIAEICAQHGLEHVVLSPGSRSAPLTLAFARHPKINTFVIPDERSAGFIALGLAQSTNKTVGVLCTSGTAVVNLYPAIIEAYYQEVPLLILTADRPPEWIDQQDGQTIRQHNIFQNHVRASFQFPVSFDSNDAIWHSERMISEAIISATGTTAGPVHVNVPIREPFYPDTNEEFHYSSEIKVMRAQKIEKAPDEKWITKLQKELRRFDKILVVAGQQRISKPFRDCLDLIQKKNKWVVVGDIISNTGSLDHSITCHDIILEDSLNQQSLRPDLLLTFGQSVLSKNVKNFIRNHPPTEHWHIGESDMLADPFQSLTQKISLPPEMLLTMLLESTPAPKKSQRMYFDLWKEKNLHSSTFVNDFLDEEKFSEFHVVREITKKLPDQSILHLANSMPVRYANYVGIAERRNIQVWANRGTSGIDGCTSTAVGHALSSTALHVIFTGDMAFFYDRNALWHNHLPPNLRIIILNNQGGGIFRLINGPKQLKELETFFETKQKLTASNTARDFNMSYYKVNSLELLPEYLERFFDEQAGPAILEIVTNPKVNQAVFEEFKQKCIQLWR